MIKVMHILADTTITGVGVWLLNFIKTFDRQRLDVTVVLPQGSELAERVEELGVRCIAVENTARLQQVKELKEIIEEQEPDIVHTHKSISACIAAKLCQRKIIETRHTLSSKKGIVKRLSNRIFNKIIGGSMVAVSQAVYNSLQDEGVSSDKIHLIYNGVAPIERYDEEKRLAVREKYGLDGKLAVGVFADLEIEQNHMMLLNSAEAAYELFPSFKFVIVGDGSLRDELQAEVERRGISDAVLFTGFAEDVTELMNAIDINVVTSNFETNIVSILQAMQVAKPCITTDTMGVREFVDSGVNAIVIPTDDAVSLTAALLKLAAEPEMRLSMGQKAAQTTCDKFSLAEMCEKLTKLYEEVEG